MSWDKLEKEKVGTEQPQLLHKRNRTKKDLQTFIKSRQEELC